MRVGLVCEFCDHTEVTAAAWGLDSKVEDKGCTPDSPEEVAVLLVVGLHDFAGCKDHLNVTEIVDNHSRVS